MFVASTWFLWPFKCSFMKKGILCFFMTIMHKLHLLSQFCTQGVKDQFIHEMGVNTLSSGLCCSCIVLQSAMSVAQFELLLRMLAPNTTTKENS